MAAELEPAAGRKATLRPGRVLWRRVAILREHLEAKGAVRSRMLVVVPQAVHAVGCPASQYTAA